MILSNEPEFSPWVIKSITEEKSFKENVFDYGKSNEDFSEEDNALLSEQNVAEDCDLKLVADVVENYDEEDEIIEEIGELEIQEVAEQVYVEPEKVLQYTTEEFDQHGEGEFLKGYNSCLENEKKDFSERREHLDRLIETIKAERVDLEQFHAPLKELLVKAIQEIAQTDMKESKKSIENILSALLAEIELDKEKSIKIFLNPSDLVFFKDSSINQDAELHFRADARLSRGSIRAVMGDSIIESIKENRVSEVVEKILGAKGKDKDQHQAQLSKPKRLKDVTKEKQAKKKSI